MFLCVFSCSLGNDSRFRWTGGGMGEFDVSSLEQIECGLYARVLQVDVCKCMIVLVCLSVCL